MKRILTMMLIPLVLLMGLIAVLPVFAAPDNTWAKLTYTLTPKTEGEVNQPVEFNGDCEIPRGCTISFNEATASLKVDGQEVANGVELTTAGQYLLTVTSKTDGKSLDYTVTLLPDINVTDGQVFTSYPTVVCENAISMEYRRNLTEIDFTSGTEIRTLGEHVVTVYGKTAEAGSSNTTSFAYHFYVRPVHSERVLDTASGKEALNVTVGSFDDREIEAILDGKTLAPGSNIVTKVGTHTLVVYDNGTEITLPQALPGSDALSLRIDVWMESVKQKEPFYFDFNGWDAKILLDGKEVTGEIRMGSHGSHTLTVVDGEGKTVENAFNLWVGEANKPTPTTKVEFTFNNPHLIYFIIAAVPAVAILAVAIYFLAARRRVV